MIIVETDGKVRKVLQLDNILEYNKVRELWDQVKYYGKLLSQYGYNQSTGQWNTKLFPVTQTDKQMEGIKSDIETFNEAANDYNKYLEYLEIKYHIDIDDGYMLIPPE
jgi:hypothetical protein